MELTSGYKQTEVGVFPYEWTVSPLGQVASIQRGKFSARPRNDPRYFGGDFPFIQTGDVTRSGGVIDSFTQSLNLEGLRVSRLFPSGTLFFTIAANIGDVGIATFEAACPDSLVAIVPSVGVDKRWLLYELAWRKEEFETLASPGAQLNINLEKLRPYLIPVPTAKEQRAIATALSDVDALIAGLDRLIAKKRDIKQAAMQQLLTGQTRLPGFSGEWNRTELKQVVSTPITDGPHLTPRFFDSGVPFLSVNNLVGNRIDLTDLRFISKEDDQVFARKCKPRIGDVLLGKAASVGKVAIVEDDFDFNIWSPIALVRAGELVHPKFLYYQLLGADCIGQISLLTNSSSQGNIGMGDIEKLQISYPGREEQQAIIHCLSDMDSDLSALEARLAKTRALKQGMMQELLTGRTRLV